MHSQGNLIGKRGALNNRNNKNTYKSYGAPMSKKILLSVFNMPDVPNQYGNPQYVKGGKVQINMNEKDPVSSVAGWNYMPKLGFEHATEYYGESALQNSIKPKKGD
jgi:hypothetical protein